jgi:hypothetical protein
MKRLFIAVFAAFSLSTSTGCTGIRDFLMDSLTHSDTAPDRSNSEAFHNHAEQGANRQSWQNFRDKD